MTLTRFACLAVGKNTTYSRNGGLTAIYHGRIRTNVILNKHKMNGTELGPKLPGHQNQFKSSTPEK